MGLVAELLLVVIGVPVLAFLALAAFAFHASAWGRSVPAARPGTLRVACVGDSITYGWPLASARYPDQLERLLGAGWSVRNFGAIGHTVQKAGDEPYWKHRYFRLGTEFAPDVVVIMMGSNDAKVQNWAGPERFTNDYKALVEHYRTLPSHPRIVLMTPPSACLVRGRTSLPSGFDADVIAQVAQITRRVGAELSLPVVDIHAATAGHPELFWVDGLHPDGAGQRLIARTLHDALPGFWQPR